MQSIGSYCNSGGSRRDAVSLSIVGAHVTFENTDESCWLSACALVNDVEYSMPLLSIRLGIPVMSCLVCLINKTPESLVCCVHVTIDVWCNNIF